MDTDDVEFDSENDLDEEDIIILSAAAAAMAAVLAAINYAEACFDKTPNHDSVCELLYGHLRDMQANFDELLPSRDQQIRRYEKELANVRAKLEAKESELEAVRLRLTDAERDLNWSKAEADALRTQIASGSVNRDKVQVTRRRMECVELLKPKLRRSGRKRKAQ